MAILQHTDPEKDYYSSIQELLTESDLAETDVAIIGWDKKFRIRALTFDKMEKITEFATDEDGKLKHGLWVYKTLVEGVVLPVITIEQARLLADKNGDFVQALADDIWRLGRVGKKVFDEYLKELKTQNAENE